MDRVDGQFYDSVQIDEKNQSFYNDRSLSIIEHIILKRLGLYLIVSHCIYDLYKKTVHCMNIISKITVFFSLPCSKTKLIVRN